MVRRLKKGYLVRKTQVEEKVRYRKMSTVGRVTAPGANSQKKGTVWLIFR